MLTVWGRRGSFNVQKVMWLVDELGITHEHIPAGGDRGGLDTPEFLAMNPHGCVPVIRDGAVVVRERHAILRHLAATHDPGRFWADSPARRSHADRWMGWSQASLQPDFLDGVFWGFYRTPEPLRDTRAVEAKVVRCAAHMRLLDRVLADRPHLGGEGPTLADIPAGAVLRRYFGLQIERPCVPNVEAWYARLQARPAYREHVMIPFEGLKGKLEYQPPEPDPACKVFLQTEQTQVAFTCATPAVPTLQQDDAAVRITRWDFEPGAVTGWHEHGWPYFVVMLDAGTLRVHDGTEVSEVPLRKGQSYMRPAGVEHDVMNGSPHPIGFVEIEVKQPGKLAGTMA